VKRLSLVLSTLTSIHTTIPRFQKFRARGKNAARGGESNKAEFFFKWAEIRSKSVLSLIFGFFFDILRMRVILVRPQI
jgi:hypothetical protein